MNCVNLYMRNSQSQWKVKKGRRRSYSLLRMCRNFASINNFFARNITINLTKFAIVMKDEIYMDISFFNNNKKNSFAVFLDNLTKIAFLCDLFNENLVFAMILWRNSLFLYEYLARSFLYFQCFFDKICKLSTFYDEICAFYELSW